MKPTREQALEQVLRFEHYGGFPGDDREQDQHELILAFREACRDATHARDVGDELIRTMQFCPKPADVWGVAAKVRSEAGQPPEWSGSESRCPYCQDTKFVSIERGGYFFAQPCDHTPDMANIVPATRAPLYSPVESTGSPVEQGSRAPLRTPIAKPVAPPLVYHRPPELPPDLQKLLERERQEKQLPGATAAT